MKDIQAKISPLVKNMFPSFYLDEGEDFVTFVEAYYEWLETNHQQLEVRSNTNFVVGDTLTQGNTTGSIVAVEGNNILVSVDGFDAFRCNVLCDEVLPVVSSSGGSTFVEKQYKLNPLYFGRKLFQIRDVDRTLEQFIVHFKEKYLKNIQFDINTNKQLLIKNSFDLYRSKGTERSIDLFFRLIYGSTATVYYPGDDLMRLSASQWYKPIYLEITNSKRTLDLVGKQITGVTSGATAFVEKYVKRRIKGTFVYVLYISNYTGEFINDELLRADTVYPDLPKVLGSLTGLTVTGGSRLFDVGDLVTFTSLRGDKAIGRIASVTNETGVVDFEFFDGGWGYTVSGPTADYSPSELAKRSQVIVSTRVLTLSNVTPSNTVSGFVINSGGSGYSNSDTITVRSSYVNCTATVNTNGSGAITNININNPGSGFFTASPNVTITTSGGTSANITATTKAFSRYFEYFEPITQRQALFVYTSASNNQLFTNGAAVYIGNSSTNVAFGTILNNANNTLINANGEMTISVSNNGSFGAGNTVYMVSNPLVYATIGAITNTSARATVMGLPYAATLALSAVSGSFAPGAEVYQLDAQGVEVANATILDTFITGLSGRIDIENLNGVFRSSGALPLNVRDSAAQAIITDVTLTVGVHNVSNTFTNTFNVPVFTTNTGTVANVLAVSSGTGANFEVGSISDSETIYLNTDRLAGNGTFTNALSQAYMTIPINFVMDVGGLTGTAVPGSEYGFPKNQAGNGDSVIFDCLNFDSFTIGTIASLIEINPGTGYTIDPYVLVEQPYLSGFDKSDYIIEYTAPTGTFLEGERILQTNTTLSKTTLVLGNEAGLAVGEKVIQGSANGIVDTIQATANTIIVREVQGTFQVNATAITSGSNLSFSTTVTSVSTNSSITSTAKGIVKSANSTHLKVKRIQFDNLFQATLDIVGQSSGTSAQIVGVVEDQSVLPIGLNANVYANVITANGYVTNIDVVDSGLGYKNGEQIVYTSEDGLRSGTAVANVSGSGIGSGYYKTLNGQLSSVSKIHDGDFYQEYSYEILSRIPLDRYAEIFKKVMHTAGTRFFGGVLLEQVVDSPLAYADSGHGQFDPVDEDSFNAQSDVSGDTITLTGHAFANGMAVRYYTASGNTALTELGNNNVYYIANTTTNTVKLITNPRVYSYSFNSNTAISADSVDNPAANDFITLPQHVLQNNEIVKYSTAVGNTAISGLANNGQYYVVSANNKGIKLSAARGGSAINISKGLTENGHTLTITTINITDGSNEAGHYIAQVNET